MYTCFHVYTDILLYTYSRSVRTLKGNKNCTINFSSFELNNKKIDYAEWHEKRCEKIQEKAEKQGEV